jgi:predicted metal-dependent HD superfamily phosphohydrolase
MENYDPIKVEAERAYSLADYAQKMAEDYGWAKNPDVFRGLGRELPDIYKTRRLELKTRDSKEPSVYLG